MLLCVSIPPQYLLRLVSLDGCGCEPNYVTPKLIFREPFVRMAINRNRINFMVMQIVAYDIRYTNMRGVHHRLDISVWYGCQDTSRLEHCSPKPVVVHIICHINVDFILSIKREKEGTTLQKNKRCWSLHTSCQCTAYCLFRPSPECLLAILSITLCMYEHANSLFHHIRVYCA